MVHSDILFHLFLGMKFFWGLNITLVLLFFPSFRGTFWTTRFFSPPFSGGGVFIAIEVSFLALFTFVSSCAISRSQAIRVLLAGPAGILNIIGVHVLPNLRRRDRRVLFRRFAVASPSLHLAFSLRFGDFNFPVRGESIFEFLLIPPRTFMSLLVRTGIPFWALTRRALRMNILVLAISMARRVLLVGSIMFTSMLSPRRCC